MAAVEFSSVAVEISVIKLAQLTLQVSRRSLLELKNGVPHFVF